jgi:RNA polymerase sigma-70 factor, ECF subfamily
MTAVEQLYREHHRFVWRSLRRMGVDPDALEDSVQEVFVVAARRLDDFEGRSSVKTWLFSIAMGVFRNERRATTRRRRRLAAIAWVQQVLSPSTKISAHDRVELMDVLMSLDEEARAIVVLMELEGMSGREVADALGLSMHAVYRRHRNACRSLETHFAVADDDAGEGRIRWTA